MMRDEADEIGARIGEAHAMLRDQIGLYFDGELAGDDEAVVLDHLADCAICQDELSDVLGIHVGAATPRAARAVSEARTSASEARTSATEARTSATEARTGATDARTVGADARTVGADARPSATDTRPSATDMRPSATAVLSGAADARGNVSEQRTAAADARGNVSEQRTAAADAQATASGTRTALADARASGTRAGLADAQMSGSRTDAPVADADKRRGDVVPLRSRRRAILLVGAALAAAALVFALWPRQRAVTTTAALALAPSRVVEARFSAGPFAAYRPYAVVRGAAAREPIALDQLAALGKAGDRGVLVAALASAGDVVRAREVAAAGPTVASDRAALALIDGQAEEAFGLLDGTAATPAAQWNLALVARALGLPSVARRHFTEVIQRGEPGWREEAARHVAALDDAQVVRAAARDFAARASAMIAGTGPAITPADAVQFPALARAALLDALRVAGDRATALALAPVADALDRATGGGHARAALDRVAAARFDVRAKLRDRYRALVVQALAPAATTALLDELRRAGPDAADIRIGALIWSGQAGARLPELAALVAATGDPWLELLVAHERLTAERAARGAAAVVTRVRMPADTCAEVWAYRCARLAWDAADALTELGRDDDALPYARRARALYAAAVAPAMEDAALAYLGELERYRDRRVLARATFEEVELRAADHDCDSATYARIGRAKLALADGRFDDARALLPAPDACQAPPDPIAVTIAVDLARAAATPRDRTTAESWLAAARAAGDPALTTLATIGAGRVAIAADPAAAAPLRDWLAANPPGDADRLAYRAWAIGALIVAAGARADWPAVAEAAAAEIAAPTTGCLVVASVDLDRQVVAARDLAGRWHGRTQRVPVAALDAARFVPADVAAALAGCLHIAVIARPPLHGSTALLPPALPWAFISGPARPAPRRAPRTVIVTDVAPPDPALRLSRLGPGSDLPAHATVVRDAAATPARVLAELAEATYVEINAHGVADVETTDASFLALSPEPSGRFMLTAGDVRAAKLDGPVVVLAACRSARLAPYLHRRWTLPDAFLAAGARAVIATDIDVPDAAAGPVFAELRTRIERGEPPAAALAAVRAQAVARDPASWVARIAVFE